MEKKLKKKIWIISTITLSAYIITLIANPTAWLALMPIIIPASVLTFGIPAYSIIKHTTQELNKAFDKQAKPIKENDIKTNQNTKVTEKVITNNVIKENQIDPIIETEYEKETPQEVKYKVKTKGTIHH